jgi:hypothetical protein
MDMLGVAVTAIYNVHLNLDRFIVNFSAYKLNNIDSGAEIRV